MAKQLSKFVESFPESGIRKMFDIAAKYDSYINLCNGEPNFVTPRHICEAVMEGLDMGLTKYAPENGIPEMRKAVADKCTAQFGFEIKPENVTVSGGSVEAIMLSLMTLVDPGDEVIIPDPAYTCYRGQVLLLGAKPVSLPLKEENNFCPTPEDLLSVITDKTKALILNYPNNPTGAALDEDAARALGNVIKQTGIYLISDEVYEKIIFDGLTHFSFGQIDDIKDQVIVCNSMSKTYAMTGWRLGYLVSRNMDVMSRIGKMHQPLTASQPGFLEYAAGKAISGPQDCVDEMVAHYDYRRSVMLRELGKIKGIRVLPHRGTFCMFVNIEQYGMSSEEMSLMLLDKARLLTTPGSAFGSCGEGWIRLSFANSDELIEEGMAKLRDFMNALYDERR